MDDPGNAKIKRGSICGKWIYTHGVVVVDRPESAPPVVLYYRTVHGQTIVQFQHYMAGQPA
jgi:hypothetical protein